MDKLYGIKDKWGNYEIIEFEIVKETPKQYKVKEIVNNGWVYEYTISKDRMECYNYIFETTIEKAQLKRKGLIRTAIRKNKETIENCKKRITVLEKLLLE